MRRRSLYLLFALVVVAGFTTAILVLPSEFAAHWGTARQSPLHSAVLADDLPTVKSLLPKAPSGSASQQLFYARSAAMAELLIASGASVHARAHGNYTPLHFAAAIGATDVMQVLLKHGADPNVINDGKVTPLMLGVGFGGDPDEGFEVKGVLKTDAQRLAACSLLINAGAKVDVPDSGGETALGYAAGQSGSVEIIKSLVMAGANVNSHTTDNVTPLHSAARAGDYDTIRYLLQHGADPTVKEWQGKRPVDCLQATGPDADKIRELLSK